MHRFLFDPSTDSWTDPTNQLIGYSLYLLGSIAPICQNFNFTFNWDRRTMAQVYQKHVHADQADLRQRTDRDRKDKTLDLIENGAVRHNSRCSQHQQLFLDSRRRFAHNRSLPLWQRLA